MDSEKTLIFKYGKGPLLLFGVVSVFLCFYAVVLLQWPGPFRDSWEFFWLYQSLFGEPLNTEKIAALFSPYGGAHRLAITHYILAIDWQWLNGKNILPMLISFSSQFGLLFGAGLFIQKADSLNFDEKASLIGLLAIILFNQSFVFSVIYSFNLQLCLAVFLLWLSAVLFFTSTKGKVFYILLLPFCLLSNFVSVAAVFIPAFYFLFKKDYTYSFLTLILAFFIIYLYLPHNNNTLGGNEDIPLIDILKFILAVLINYTHFVFRYLSSPLSISYPLPAMLISASSIIYLFYLFIHRVVKKGNRPIIFDIYLALSLITIFIAYTAAFGRFNPMAAMAERYQPAVIFYWFCFSQLVFLATKKIIIKILIIAVSITIFIPSQKNIIDDNIFLSEKVSLANHSANLGILHVDAVRPALSYPLNSAGINPIETFNDLIQSEQKAYYAEIPNIASGDISCPINIKTITKLSLSKIFKNTKYQWYEVTLGMPLSVGNISLEINNIKLPGRIIRQSLWSKKSNILYFIAPLNLSLNKNTSIQYLIAENQYCKMVFNEGLD